MSRCDEGGREREAAARWASVLFYLCPPWHTPPHPIPHIINRQGPASHMNARTYVVLALDLGRVEVDVVGPPRGRVYEPRKGLCA